LDAITPRGKKYEMKAADKLSSAEFMAASKDDAFKNVTARGGPQGFEEQTRPNRR
jgi:hypothetical protein